MKIQKHQIYAFVEITQCLFWLKFHPGSWSITSTRKDRLSHYKKQEKKFSRLSPQYPPHVEAGKTQSQKRSGESPRDFYQQGSWGLCLCGS